ncbi:MAG: hypothetical protein ACJZ7Z_05760 [Myxococcota bacterium]
MKKYQVALLTGLAILLASPVMADTSNQFVFAGIRTPNDDNVTNFRFSLLFASANNVSGFDLGFVSIAESNNFNGFGPLFAIANVQGDSQGCLCSFGNFVGGDSKGVAAGFINVIQKNAEGTNMGFLNVTSGSSNVDISGLGISKESKIQIGIVNVTEKIESVQIGFLNFAKNGFFPVFPFINFPKSE